MKYLTPFLFFIFSISALAQTNQRIYNIIDSVSAERIQKDVQTLVNFGTRNTFSDTLSNIRGIGLQDVGLNLNLSLFLITAITA